ncbi:MAG: nucleotidyltransferase family protein [Phycisphaeraceae bacterium]|nr:nucleotidyltransferase family protein [Phycisphaeraceae bacterium]
MTTSLPHSSFLLQRMVDAVEQVRNRLLKACATLRAANIDYAVVGGNAVATWVATVDQAAVRNTQDVDLLVRRSDFNRVKASLEAAGFTYRRAAGLELFLDQGASSPRDAVHLVFANEIVRAGEPAPNPGVEESTDLGDFRVINLEALVRIKLTAFRDKDRTHLRDLIGVGLVDAAWISRLPGEMAKRLQSLLDTPDG